MKVVILCGGDGMRLSTMLEPIPKAMVHIGHRPMVWHVMKIFSKFGYNEFVLALGTGGERIRDYFLNYNLFTNNVTIELGNPNGIVVNTQNQERDWKITFVDTGDVAGTGARLARCEDVVIDDTFFLTYADCLSNVDISALYEQHNASKNVVTLTGVYPPFRYGEFIMEGRTPVAWNAISTLKSQHGWVNGGFMVMDKEIFGYVDQFNECILEKDVFSTLVKDKKIGIYEHTKFWQCLDNEREFRLLNSMYEDNNPLWLQ